jgi:hypothetical protein
MISQRKFRTLVERVLIRLKEANPAFSRTMPAPATAQTQYPDSPQSPKTVPAARSGAEQAANAELAGMNTRNPKAAPLSQKSMKVNAIKKALDTQGWTAQQGIGDNDLVQGIKAWYDSLDPGDALVSTADQLATRYTEEG